jgi:hypothetical protein
MQVAEQTRYYIPNSAWGSRPELNVEGYESSQEAMAALDAAHGRKLGFVCRSATPTQFASWNKYNRWKLVDGKAVNVPY